MNILNSLQQKNMWLNHVGENQKKILIEIAMLIEVSQHSHYGIIPLISPIDTHLQLTRAQDL